MRWAAALLVLWAILAGNAFAQAPRRVALVISNGAYINVRTLPNAVRDGELMAATLRAKGYEVRVARNLAAAAQRGALVNFSLTANGADTALVYVSGHGVITRGTSRFVGVDAPRNLSDSVLATYSMTVADVFTAVGGARRRVVLFDACRESPFAVLTAPSPRGVGFAFTDISRLRDESYLAHAARAGAYAFDGEAGGNGPFATALSARLAADGDSDIAALLGHVRADVAAATDGTQEPALYLPPRAPVPLAPAVANGPCVDCPAAALVAAPAGVFLFGAPVAERGRDADEVAPTTVRIGAIDVWPYEITRGAFARFVTDTGRVMAPGCQTRTGAGATVSESAEASWRAPGFAQTDDHPVVCVDWQDARDYARWLSARTGRTWRLPTEAEWEYMARAGTQAPFFWGEDRVQTCTYGNGDDLTAPVMAPSQCRDSFQFTAPVGHFRANAWGVFDTAGNVWEWTLDCDDGAAAAPPADGAARQSGQCANRTIRGGSFDYGPNFLRSASRHRLPPDARNASVGFRLVRER